ncbi:MarR family protein [Novosphingobium sp. PhB55]|uniref:MarR family winged helix-turn-helix transcriptional regulator n=1 Tax=Novosphingobium sp. PhB55 TaxID=2485106 RepID=UPI0010647424|nr:MarR family transcriptional regulator [Novosphingobium sp. PhB55]TDW61456.1 MarR family protein [Novosphingobium sp. PhB55]
MTEKRKDYSRAAGAAALGARLRRLSERLDRETAEIYVAQGIRFEQRWFGVLNQIVLNGPMTVGDIAEALCITHVSVSQARRALESAGLIQMAGDKADARRRLISLSAQGDALVAALAPLWAALSESAKELDAEAGHLVPLLDRLEDALDVRALSDRVAARLGV